MMDLDTPLTILGGMSAGEFLRDYWQQKPLLIRAAAKHFELPISADELAGLAMEEEVEARIVLESGATPWELRQGPFSEADFADLPEREWTLLVQAVDHWVPEVQELREAFNFLPSWRVDDVMISYAVTGGSVGPHYDQYDVFLVQMAGKRRWQVLAPEQYQDQALVGTKLHILDNFPVDPTMEWDVETGDILYLPPNWGHNGRALDDDCMTFSIGFRAPAAHEALAGITEQVCEQANEKLRFAATETEARLHHSHISIDDIQHLRDTMTRLLADDALLASWLGETMSAPKYPEYSAPLSGEEVDEVFDLVAQGVKFIRPGDARLCYYTLSDNVIRVFANGEYHDVDGELVGLVQALADQLEFDFSGLDLTQHPQLPELLRFLLQQQVLVPLD
ncbi:cupin domain-containing protein [Maribrevibacterium harenarium]|uniref:Cupin domain-containing protein n=1 Tax=Maribrevibacterium harenarium TaxID=2589817 RepID=A0A501WMC5_9GAMM|nr:cupin domain-containing protein [Maribrevibacterium harenarium]TPE49334.1 cupin domain-containing protein [Maribrevibacterium harenarium]